jgi:hypothetical protein
MRSTPGAILTFAATALVAWAGSQPLYLPAVGPVPMRFRAAPDPAAARAALGPLPPAQDVPGPSEPAVPETPSLARAEAPAAPAPQSPPVAPAAEPPPAPVVLPSAPAGTPANPPTAATNQAFVFPSDPNPPAALTPQMLLQFFKDQASRRDDSGVLVPVAIQPQPANRPSSTATFISPTR